MKNYNTLNGILKDETVNFIKKLSKELGKVDTHFISDIVTGVITNDSDNTLWLEHIKVIL